MYICTFLEYLKVTLEDQIAILPTCTRWTYSNKSVPVFVVSDTHMQHSCYTTSNTSVQYVMFQIRNYVCADLTYDKIFYTKVAEQTSSSMESINHTWNELFASVKTCRIVFFLYAIVYHNRLRFSYFANCEGHFVRK